MKSDIVKKKSLKTRIENLLKKYENIKIIDIKDNLYYFNCDCNNNHNFEITSLFEPSKGIPIELTFFNIFIFENLLIFSFVEGIIRDFVKDRPTVSKLIFKFNLLHFLIIFFISFLVNGSPPLKVTLLIHKHS